MSGWNLLRRRASGSIDAALSDTRVVLIHGARQSGKSTLAQQVSRQRGGEWRDLDQFEDRRAAHADPVGFVDSDTLMVIDEIQRVPDLLLPIKVAVDADRRPGRYLLTGSARLLGLRTLPDTLPGRMESIELWPFSQGEIDDSPDGFVDEVFRQGANIIRKDSDVSRSEYTERLVRGGFPEAVARSDERRREQFFDNYLSNMIERDIRQLSDIGRTQEMKKLVELLAGRSGTLVTANALSSALSLTNKTIQRYLQLLEDIFLIKRIPGWSRNMDTRATSTPKLFFVDSGIAAHLLRVDAHRLRRPGAPFGPLLEGFVISELSRQLTWSQTSATLYHYRDRNKVEVDIVLENRRGQVVAIEVKAASTVRSEDFRGLKKLQQKLGEDFLVGIVLYTGSHALPFGEGMRALPVSALWQTGPR